MKYTIVSLALPTPPLLLSFSFLLGTQAALVVTMGDSYATGNGIHTLRQEYDDPLCTVEKDTIPGGKYAWTQGMDHVVTACGGNTVAQTVEQWDNLQLGYPDEVAVLWEGSVILVTTGGNSLRTQRGQNFQQTLPWCLLGPACHLDQLNQIANLDHVQQELEVLYTKLAMEAGEATVRVIGYPKVFHPNNPATCFISGISVEEADFLDNLILDTNERIMLAVDTVKASFPDFDIQFVDVTAYYTNGACFPSNNRQVRSINPTFPLSSFHPTQRGYDKAYDAFLDTVIGYILYRQ